MLNSNIRACTRANSWPAFFPRRCFHVCASVKCNFECTPFISLLCMVTGSIFPRRMTPKYSFILYVWICVYCANTFYWKLKNHKRKSPRKDARIKMKKIEEKKKDLSRKWGIGNCQRFFAEIFWKQDKYLSI